MRSAPPEPERPLVTGPHQHQPVPLRSRREETRRPQDRDHGSPLGSFAPDAQWAQTLTRRLLDLETDHERDLLLVSRAIIETPRRLTRLEEQVADLRSRQDEFDLTPHDMPR